MKKNLLAISAILLLTGCARIDTATTADREPLLEIVEDRFIICQDGKVFRDVGSYPNVNLFFFLTKLNQNQIKTLKSTLGGTSSTFSGPEFEVSEGDLGINGPDYCHINYYPSNRTRNIDYRECEVLISKAQTFVQEAGFNIRQNYGEIVEISPDAEPRTSGAYQRQAEKLCPMPVVAGRPAYDNINWKKGVKKYNGVPVPSGWIPSMYKKDFE